MENQPLDLLDIQEELTYDHASKGQRFANLIIDTIILQVIIYFLTTGIPNPSSGQGLGMTYLITLAIYFLYYTIFEYSTGKTIGKFITNTQVLRESDLNKISVNQAMGRSISRMVPFEAFSFFGSAPTGWHDRWTNTVVIKANSLRR